MCVLVKVGVPQNLKVDRQFPNVAPFSSFDTEIDNSIYFFHLFPARSANFS